MQRIFILLTSLALLIGLLALAGCGGSQAGLAPTTAKATGTMSVKVAWPTTGARMIPGAAYTLAMKVTGPGIAEPIVASISRPNTVLTATVPVGTGRAVEITALDEGGAAIAHGGQGGLTVAANQTTPVTITLVGMEDPNGWENPIPIILDATTGIGSTEALLDTRGDDDDCFVFDAKEGMGYTVVVESLELGKAPETGWAYLHTEYLWLHPYDGWEQWEQFTTMDNWWNTDNQTFGANTIVLTSPYTGQIRLRAYLHGDYWDSSALRYKVTVTEGGEGGIDATVQ
jgi:hypothetical protein